MASPTQERNDIRDGPSIAEGAAGPVTGRSTRLSSRRQAIEDGGGPPGDGGGGDASPRRGTHSPTARYDDGNALGDSGGDDGEFGLTPAPHRGRPKKRGSNTVGRPRRGARQATGHRLALFSHAARDRARRPPPHRNAFGDVHPRPSASPAGKRLQIDSRLPDVGDVDSLDDDAFAHPMITGATMDAGPSRASATASASARTNGPGRPADRRGTAPGRLSERELQQLIASGGAGAPHAGGATGFDPITSQALGAITEQAVYTLLGSVRGRLLKLDTTSARNELRELKQANAIYEQLRKQGTAVPDSLCNTIIFFTFQSDPWRLLKQAPFSMRRLRQWAHGMGRWQIPTPGDESQKSEFMHLVGEFDKIAVQLDEALATTTRIYGSVMRPSLREKSDRLIVRFCDWRHRHVSVMVERALGDARLSDFHAHYRALNSAYADEAAWIQLFLTDLGKQFSMAAISKGGPDAQEDHTARAWLGVYSAFLSGLHNGDLPAIDPAERPLAAGPTSADGGSCGPLPHTVGGAGGAATLPSAAFHYQLGPPAPAPRTTAIAPPSAPYPSPYPSDGALSLDQIARQVWAGYRSPGAALGGGGGAVDGIDLPDDTSRRLLFAHQTRNGLRSVGDLFMFSPRAFAALPPLPDRVSPPPPPSAQSYLPARSGLGSAPQAPLPPPPPYAAPPGGTGPPNREPRAGGAARTQPRPSTQSDELFVPYSPAMLGNYTPFREIRPPAVCYECNAPNAHFGNECPLRFSRVRGETPPGWMQERGSIVRTPAAGNRSELTPEARSEYRAFLARHPVPAHHGFPVSIDDITSAQPPPVRRAVGGRRQ